MKVIKIAATIAYCFLIALFIVIITANNPDVAFYNKTVEVLINQEGLASEDEVLKCFPVLKDIKSKMARVAYLDYIIESNTHCPAPMVTEAESKQLIIYMQEIRQLRRSITQELTQIMATQQIETP